MDTETARIVLPLIGSVLVGFLGFASAMVVLFRTLQNQRDIELIKDARTLRDAKRERLRQLFEAVLFAAWTISTVISRRRFLLDGETVESRDAMLQQMLSDALQNLNRIRLSLLLESDAAPFVQRFEKAYGSFQTVLMLQQLRQRDQTEAISWQQIEQLEQEVHAGAKELEETMHATLAALEQPIRTA